MGFERVHVGTGVTELDRIMDPSNPRNAGFAEFFDSAALERDAVHEAKQVVRGMERAGVSPGGDLMRLALIPRKIWHRIRRVEPDIQKDRELLYRLLRRYSIYKPGYVKIIGGQGCSFPQSQDGDDAPTQPASTTGSTPPSTPGTSTT